MKSLCNLKVFSERCLLFVLQQRKPPKDEIQLRFIRGEKRKSRIIHGVFVGGLAPGILLLQEDTTLNEVYYDWDENPMLAQKGEEWDEWRKRASEWLFFDQCRQD